MAVDVDFAGGADASLQTDILPTQGWQPWQVTQGHLTNARFKCPAVTMRPVTVEQRLELDMDKSASRGDDQGDTNDGVKSLVMRRRARQGIVGNTLTNCNN